LQLVSFCIPAYNAEPFIRFTLESIVSQTYSDIEIIIIDDHSTDQTINIINNIEDQRISLHTANGKGAAAARNQALALAKGKYIIFFDADDWIPSTYLETQLDTIIAENEVVVCKWGRFVNNDITTLNIDKHQIKRDLTFKEWILGYWGNNTTMTCPGRVLIPKKLINLSGNWDGSLSLNDDFQFFSQIFSNCSMIRFNNSSTFYYRSGVSGLSSQKGQLAYASLYKSISFGVNLALDQYPNDKLIKKACANLMRNFVYETYPDQPDLIEEANAKIVLLGGADSEFPAGGKTKIFVKFFGWRLLKKMKFYLDKSPKISLRKNTNDYN